MSNATRRRFLGATATSAAALALPRTAFAQGPLAAIRAEVGKRHDEGVKRLQDWIRLPSIAAEGRAMNRTASTAAFGARAKPNSRPP